MLITSFQRFQSIGLWFIENKEEYSNCIRIYAHVVKRKAAIFRSHLKISKEFDFRRQYPSQMLSI